jgi:hypothetical protein
MDIEEALDIINHKAMVNMLTVEEIVSLSEFVKSQAETIESLKCCGNCGIDKDYTQDSICFHCKKGDCFGNELDNWQQIK